MSKTHEELELKTSGLLLDGAIEAAISMAVLYIAAWALILAVFNKFWLEKLFPPKVNLATLKERKDRVEKALHLNRMVKLGTAPSKSMDLLRGPTTKGAKAVLTSEQLLAHAQVEKRRNRLSNRRVSRFFDMPSFKKNVCSNEPSGLPPALTSPSHIKRTHVFLPTPVVPPPAADHLKKVDEEKQHEAWEEYYSEAHGRPYWVNSLTEESTWTEPLVLASKLKFTGELIEGSSWRQCWSDSFQRPYWHNVDTGENTWRDPFKYADKNP